MLGLQDTKGCLTAGADADLVVLDETVTQEESRMLEINQVWKFGNCVFDSSTI
jgi:N-acetylglucosamine-6-phosphate deacetylase